MVRLLVTPSLGKKLEGLGDIKRDGGQLPLELLEAIQAHLDAKQAWVEHKLLAQVSRWNKSSSSPRREYTLRELIRGSEVYIDPPVAQKRSPELEAILAPIRLAQEQATYASFLSSSSSSSSGNAHKDPFSLHTTDTWDFRTASHPNTSVKQEWDAVRRELSAVANVVASMAAVATAVWWAAGTTPLAQKTLMSLFGALAIAAIEGFLYTRFFQRMREAHSRKQSALNVKTATSKSVKGSIAPAARAIKPK